jgi:SAM-dependent methyltransferase
MKYISKSCLFCDDDSCNEELYQKTFSDEDLDPNLFSARRVTEHFHYKIVKCNKTGLIFSKEILPDDELEKLYADSKVTFNKYNNIIGKDYMRQLLKNERKLIKENALEIGCSNGFFLEELLNWGFKNVFGCEPSSEAKEMAPEKIKQNIYTGFFSDEIYKDNFFDLICCFQTLDHLSNPLEFLNICNKKLKKNGVLYIIVHNTKALQYKLFREKSPIIDIEHIYLFNPNNIDLLLKKTGYKNIDVFTIKNSYPLEYWLEHAPIPFKNFFIKISGLFKIDKVKFKMNFGNMGIISFKNE